MTDFQAVFDNFNGVYQQDSRLYISENLVEILNYLKNTPEFDFDMLTSIIAVDKIDYIELIYQLYSSKNNNSAEVVFSAYGHAPSVISVYKSAYFDECEIYDLFGVNFSENENLKRLFMPESWIGHPLLKNYKLNDERLVWND